MFDEIGTIRIFKQDDKLSLHIIAYDILAERLDISDGLWTDVELTDDVIKDLITAILKTDYDRTRGKELDYMTALNGELWKDMSRLG